MFTYIIQLAGYPHEKYDEKGQTTYNEFITTFDTFPWLDQCEASNQMKDGCSATISVLSTAYKLDLWISIAGDTNKHVFLIGYNSWQTKKPFLGLGNEKKIKWVEIYEIEDKEIIKHLFKLFFDHQYKVLQSELKQLKHFDSMEAYIQ